MQGDKRALVRSSRKDTITVKNLKIYNGWSFGKENFPYEKLDSTSKSCNETWKRGFQKEVCCGIPLELFLWNIHHLISTFGGIKTVVWNEAVWKVCTKYSPSYWKTVHRFYRKPTFNFLETSLNQDFLCQRRESYSAMAELQPDNSFYTTSYWTSTISNPIFRIKWFAQKNTLKNFGAWWHFRISMAKREADLTLLW